MGKTSDDAVRKYPAPPYKKAVLTEYGLLVESKGREVIQYDPDAVGGRRDGYSISIKQNGILFDRVVATSDSAEELIAFEKAKSGGKPIMLGAYSRYPNI